MTNGLLAARVAVVAQEPGAKDLVSERSVSGNTAAQPGSGAGEKVVGW